MCIRDSQGCGLRSAVVRCHSIDNGFGLMVFLTKFNTKIHMGSFYFMVNGLSNIMEKTGTLSHTNIQAQLLRDVYKRQIPKAKPKYCFTKLLEKRSTAKPPKKARKIMPIK